MTFELLDDLCKVKTLSFLVLASSVKPYKFFADGWFHFIVQGLDTVLDLHIG